MGEATVTIEDVQHVADLASLELTPQELPKLAKDLNAVLGYIAQLNELNTGDVPAMAQASEVLGLAAAERGETLRPDEVLPSIDRAEVMREAPETDGRLLGSEGDRAVNTPPVLAERVSGTRWASALRDLRSGWSLVAND